MDDLGHKSLVDLLDEGVCEVAQVLLARPKLVSVCRARLLPVVIEGQYQLQIPLTAVSCCMIADQNGNLEMLWPK